MLVILVTISIIKMNPSYSPNQSSFRGGLPWARRAHSYFHPWARRAHTLSQWCGHGVATRYGHAVPIPCGNISNEYAVKKISPAAGFYYFFILIFFSIQLIIFL